MNKFMNALMLAYGLVFGLWFSGFAVLFLNNPQGVFGNVLAALAAIMMNVLAFNGLERLLEEKGLMRTSMIAAIVVIVAAFALRIAGVLPTAQ